MASPSRLPPSEDSRRAIDDCVDPPSASRDLAAQGRVDHFVAELLTNDRVERWSDRNDLASTINGVALARDPSRLRTGEVTHSAGDVDGYTDTSQWETLGELS